jgi:hypothetical protein
MEPAAGPGTGENGPDGIGLAGSGPGCIMGCKIMYWNLQDSLRVDGCKTAHLPNGGTGAAERGSIYRFAIAGRTVKSLPE